MGVKERGGRGWMGKGEGRERVGVKERGGRGWMGKGGRRWR